MKKTGLKFFTGFLDDLRKKSGEWIGECERSMPEFEIVSVELIESSAYGFILLLNYQF